MISSQEAILSTVDFVKNTLKDDYSGHDWLHVERVWKMASFLAKKEGANLFIVELAALLHDIADWKFHDGDEDIAPKKARTWLNQLLIPEEDIVHICDIIKKVSFKGAKVKSQPLTLEGKIVQDADRLDAMGAIGIARTFTYGGYKNRPMYDLSVEPELHSSFEEYKKNTGNTLNHFYEKLLLLKDLINTDAAKKIAEHRHKIMELFLEEINMEIQF